jgi:hypothetical protein
LLEAISANTAVLSQLLSHGVEGVWEWDTFKTGYDHMMEIESK